MKCWSKYWGVDEMNFCIHIQNINFNASFIDGYPWMYNYRQKIYRKMIKIEKSIRPYYKKYNNILMSTIVNYGIFI